jgi:uncharacterized protein (DUF2141 family)
MVRKAMFLLVILFLVSSLVHAQETFTVSGEVSFSKDADIYLLLKTKQEQKQDTIPSSRTVIINLTAEQKAAKKASFTFVDVPVAFYAIHCFQDMNGNGKVDRCPRGFLLEPFATYKPSLILEYLDWRRNKFKVNKDITGIKIEL